MHFVSQQVPLKYRLSRRHFVSDIDIDPKIASYKEIDRNLIIDRCDLASFEMTWRRLSAERYQIISKTERRAFLDDGLR